jgi:hypothetical protein
LYSGNKNYIKYFSDITSNLKWKNPEQF